MKKDNNSHVKVIIIIIIIKLLKLWTTQNLKNFVTRGLMTTGFS